MAGLLLSTRWGNRNMGLVCCFLKLLVFLVPALYIGFHISGALGLFIAIAVINVLTGIFFHLFGWKNATPAAALREKIEELIGADDKKKLLSAAESVSLKYRRESGNDFQISSDDEARAYIATRLPATFCAVTEVLNRYLEIDPGFTPSSVLDLGAGPGTATLAAKEFWPDIDATLIEPNRLFEKHRR